MWEQLAKQLQEKYQLDSLYIHEFCGWVVLDEIVVSRDKAGRNKGIGSKVMKEILAEVDKQNARIALTPDPTYGQSNKNRLKRFYKRFGFIENKGRNKDYTTRQGMIRRSVNAQS